MENGRRRGRPPSTRAQEAIRAAASRLFAQHGFSATSVRDVAAAAGVDPAIVMRHFGSKDALFLETMSVDEGIRGIVDDPLEGLGRRILDRLVAPPDEERARIFSALVGALDREDVRTYMEGSARRHIIEPLRMRLEGPDADLRAELIAAQITGFLVAVWVTPALRRPVDTVTHMAAVYGRALQTLIDG